MTKENTKYKMLENILERDPHAFDRVNAISPSDLRGALSRSEAMFDPSYTIDKNGELRIHEISLVRNPYKID